MRKKKKFDGTITSLTDALRLFKKLSVSEFVQSVYREDSTSRFPFGIWFRGQNDARWELRPKVFRERAEPAIGSGPIIYDETNLVAHARVRLASLYRTGKSTFDWLCLLQRYDVPTRLLDWSESMLVALFFAVCGSVRESTLKGGRMDGEVVVLNARRLNFIVRRSYAIRTSESLNVIARAELAEVRSMPEHQERMGQLRIPLVEDGSGLDAIKLARLCLRPTRRLPGLARGALLQTAVRRRSPREVEIVPEKRDNGPG